MAYSTFYHLRLSGISVVVPKHEIRLEDELEYFGGNLKKVERMKKISGLGCRRIADEGVTAADLCQQAAEKLFDGMGIEKSSIDALIFITQGPDHAIPATSCILQNKLHLPLSCATFDINQGCAAYTYGLWLGGSLIESRACNRVLLLVGESGARYYNPANRIVAPLFGDCGSATILEYSKCPSESFFLLGTDGSGSEALIVPAGHARFPLPRDESSYKTFINPIKDAKGNPWLLNSIYMDGGEIFKFTLMVVPTHINSLLGYAKCTIDDINFLILHQANKQIVETIAQKTGFSLSKVPLETLSKYGNQSGASLPSVICDQLCGTVRDESPKLLLSGYGVGLSWASAILKLDHIWCSGIQEFQTPSNLPSQKDLEDYWRKKIQQEGED